MEYEGFKNYSTWNLALTIDNDKDLQDSILKGLDVCARRFLGFNPKGTSHPFITMNAQMRHQISDSVILVNEAQKEKDLKAGRTTAALDVFGIRTSGSALVQSAKLGFDENFKAAEVDSKQIVEHIISKHWAHALERTGKVKRHTQEDSLSHS
jgi:hypothetical protein